ATLVQGQFEHAMVARVTGDAVAVDLAGEAVELLAAGTDDELPQPVGCIGVTGGVHGRKALIVMVVAVDVNVRPGVVQILPEPLTPWVVSMIGSRAEPRLVPDRGRAGGGVGRQVGAE